MAERQDEHIIEAIGKARIVIRDGSVVEVGQAIITDCPLAKRFAYPIPEMNPDTIRENIQHRIKAFGMCTPDRTVTDDREFVGFGASEILSFALKADLIDCAVLACDGAGTVIATTPGMVQGIGGRMSGLVSTVPYDSVIRRIKEGGGIVLDQETGRIDQQAGVQLAADAGYRRIAVTIARSDDAAAIRKKHPDALIISVHTTGCSQEEAEEIVNNADLTTGCASASIREAAGNKALVQAGVSVPVFAMTSRGKDLLIEKIRRSNDPVLIKQTSLPAIGGTQPHPLI